MFRIIWREHTVFNAFDLLWNVIMLFRKRKYKGGVRTLSESDGWLVKNFSQRLLLNWSTRQLLPSSRLWLTCAGICRRSPRFQYHFRTHADLLSSTYWAGHRMWFGNIYCTYGSRGRNVSACYQTRGYKTKCLLLATRLRQTIDRHLSGNLLGRWSYFVERHTLRI